MVYHHLDATFAALADPTRRELLARLATGDKTISELASRFDMSLPAVSKHLRVLERAGLARIRREGRVRHTTLVAAPMRGALEWIERYRQFWEFQFDELAKYLAHQSSTEESTTWQTRQPPRTRPSRSAASSPRRASESSTRGRGRKN